MLILTSKFYFIFSYFEHYSFFLTTSNIILLRCFFRLSIFLLEPSPSMYFVYISGVDVSYHHRKKTHSRFSCFSSSSSLVRLSDICCRSSLWVLSCAVVSHDVVHCSGQYLSSSSLNLANVRNYISLGWSEFSCL